MMQKETYCDRSGDDERYERKTADAEVEVVDVIEHQRERFELQACISQPRLYLKGKERTQR